uniref:Ion transport domain-containing protein n=1 Tax=Ditylenchus dipsaci TaxID=166011 RepID=A0A915CZG8_9BILA
MLAVNFMAIKRPAPIFLRHQAGNFEREYLENGVYIIDPVLTSRNYFSSISFIADIISILPTDLILLYHPQFSIVRVNRLFKLYRALEFVHLAEIRTNFPHLFRVIRLTFVCLGVFHCNGCLYYLLSLVYNFEVSWSHRKTSLK